jgi:hypothetical protein
MRTGHWLEYATDLVPLAVGLIIVFRSDAIVDGIVTRHQLSELNQTDVRFRNARIIFRAAGCASVIAGIWGLVHTVMLP